MSLRWELAPYSEPWPPGGPSPKSAAIFKADWNSTLRLLDEETGRLDAGLVTIEVDCPASQLTRARQSFTFGGPATAGVRVLFDSVNGRQRYATAAYSTWRGNVRAIALSLTALRAVDRYGVSSGEQYVGFRPAIEAAPEPVFDSPRDALRWMRDRLVLAGGTPDMAADVSYKRLAKLLHPDSGEPSPDWAKLEAAKQLLSDSGVL